MDGLRLWGMTEIPEKYRPVDKALENLMFIQHMQLNPDLFTIHLYTYPAKKGTRGHFMQLSGNVCTVYTSEAHM